MTSADDIIRILGLTPHQEGGNYRENYRDVPTNGSRGSVSSIYFMLRAGERSHWHRFDAVELWCYHSGAPLELTTWVEGGSLVKYRLGTDLAAGQRPVVNVDDFYAQNLLHTFTHVNEEVANLLRTCTCCVETGVMDFGLYRAMHCIVQSPVSVAVLGWGRAQAPPNLAQPPNF